MLSCSSAPGAGARAPNAATIMAASDRPIPSRTLWRAMTRERVAIAIASGQPVQSVDGQDDVRGL